MHEIFIFTFEHNFLEKHYIIVQENESIAWEYFEKAFPNIEEKNVVVKSKALDEPFTLYGQNLHPQP